MISEILFLLTFIAFVSAGTGVCMNKSPCKCVTAPGQAIDLSSVGVVNFPRFYEIEGLENDKHLYSYNPCYSFSSPAHQYTLQKDGNKPCVDAAACIKSPGGNNGDFPEENAIGIQSEGEFGYFTAENETSMYYINYTVPSVKGTLMVYLNCSMEHEKPLLIVDPESKTPDLTVMTLSSKCACINSCPSHNPDEPDEGMSTGSKLLIAFFTIVLAYFLIGMGWNFCNGAHGLELVPNYEFWNELPKLVIEGVAFTCSCFGRRTAYGEV